ncbi:thioredoxin domain-containing protein [Maribacter sp. R77961]|uniref:thioredoxin domain-containing protein n=1 Tax=Maribacter sp. R77961 TaxID=3093871 RepID=UPI0037C53EE3
MQPKHTNSLIKETSPYLLQHAHNPVNWEAWNPEVLKRAKTTNKPLLISIGYAACHWCHVMEHECFEDEEVAKVMNENFINIKIDREERPDIDHIYMDALQMMTGSGGWPLNIIALPDGRPYWGATYVKKEDWITVLTQLSTLYTTEPDKVITYARNMAEGIKQINLVETNTDTNSYSLEELKKCVEKWSGYFDTFLGGYKRAPKFMMPVNLDFLLHYAISQKSESILEYVNTTLNRMAYGGIFDHVDGGFSRYAVDTKWHVPHFEKMLYDNGQLISLYAKSYASTENPLYKEVTEKTIHFVTSELRNEKGAFYSSLDADSLNDFGKLEEGAYYVWKAQELKRLLKDDYPVFKDYYNINSYGLWEHENYVLIRDQSDDEIARKHHIDTIELKSRIRRSLELLSKERKKRDYPRLDDKILTSWNGLLLKGLVDAARYLENDSYLSLALENAEFILENLTKPDGSLYHNHKEGTSTINGYLEDYASVIDAFIGLYEITFDEKWLLNSKRLTDYCIDNFYDAKSSLFFFSSTQDAFVIRRTIEIADNVVPASNSIMALNLLRLSKVFQKTAYKITYQKMLKNVEPNFDDNPQNYANWLHLILLEKLPFYEIAIVGDDYKEKAQTLTKAYLPNTIITGTQKKSELPLLKNRFVAGSTHIYICQEGSCKLPLTQTKEVLTLLRANNKD